MFVCQDNRDVAAAAFGIVGWDRICLRCARQRIVSAFSIEFSRSTFAHQSQHIACQINSGGILIDFKFQSHCEDTAQWRQLVQRFGPELESLNITVVDVSQILSEKCGDIPVVSNGMNSEHCCMRTLQLIANPHIESHAQ